MLYVRRREKELEYVIVMGHISFLLSDVSRFPRVCSCSVYSAKMIVSSTTKCFLDGQVQKECGKACSVRSWCCHFSCIPIHPNSWRLGLLLGFGGHSFVVLAAFSVYVAFAWLNFAHQSCFFMTQVPFQEWIKLYACGNQLYKGIIAPIFQRRKLKVTEEPNQHQASNKYLDRIRTWVWRALVCVFLNILAPWGNTRVPESRAERSERLSFVPSTRSLPSFYMNNVHNQTSVFL